MFSTLPPPSPSLAHLHLLDPLNAMVSALLTRVQRPGRPSDQVLEEILRRYPMPAYVIEMWSSCAITHNYAEQFRDTAGRRIADCRRFSGIPGFLHFSKPIVGGCGYSTGTCHCLRGRWRKSEQYLCCGTIIIRLIYLPLERNTMDDDW